MNDLVFEVAYMQKIKVPYTLIPEGDFEQTESFFRRIYEIINDFIKHLFCLSYCLSYK